MRLVGAARREGLAIMVGDIFNYPQLKKLAAVTKVTVTTDQTVAPFSLLDQPLNYDEKRPDGCTM